jgi:DNA polymerase I-like protein with 3'-5' exonuclease and polymerase domains
MHDELIYQIPIKSSDRAAKLLKHSMENSIKLTVPLQVKVKIGPNWGALKETEI